MHAKDRRHSRSALTQALEGTNIIELASNVNRLACEVNANKSESRHLCDIQMKKK
jgi:hypothetical protein